MQAVRMRSEADRAKVIRFRLRALLEDAAAELEDDSCSLADRQLLLPLAAIEAMRRCLPHRRGRARLVQRVAYKLGLEVARKVRRLDPTSPAQVLADQIDRCRRRIVRRFGRRRTVPILDLAARWAYQRAHGQVQPRRIVIIAARLARALSDVCPLTVEGTPLAHAHLPQRHASQGEPSPVHGVGPNS